MALTPELEALFFRKFCHSLPYGVYPDEEESDKLVLFVLDEFPVETINEFLRKDAAKFHDVSKIRIAATYKKLPDYLGYKITNGTKTPINPAWRSRFVGKSLADCVAWIRGIPKPPKAANKIYFAALKKELYEEKNQVLMCKVIEGESEPQTIPCSANMLTVWSITHHSDQWEDAYLSQKLI